MAENLVVSRYFSNNYKLASRSSLRTYDPQFKGVDSDQEKSNQLQLQELGFTSKEIEQSEKHCRNLNIALKSRIVGFENVSKLDNDESFCGFSSQDVISSETYHQESLRSCLLVMNKTYESIDTKTATTKMHLKKQTNKLTATKTKSKKTKSKNQCKISGTKSTKSNDILSPCRSKYFKRDIVRSSKMDITKDKNGIINGLTKVKNLNNNSNLFSLLNDIEETKEISILKPELCDNIKVKFGEKGKLKAPAKAINLGKKSFAENYDIRINNKTRSGLNLHPMKDEIVNNISETMEQNINMDLKIKKEKQNHEITSSVKLETGCYGNKNVEEAINELNLQLKDIKLKHEVEIQNNKQTKEGIRNIKLEIEVNINYTIDYEAKYFGLMKINKRNIVKNEENPDIPSWIPPRSPHNLIEEVLYHDPWALLVATIFLNRTSCMVARPHVFWFLTENPDPYQVLDKYPQDLEKYFVNLGLIRTRAVQIWRMSNEYLQNKWKNPSDLYGIGEYGDSAYRIFCLGDFSIQPKDRFLRIYKAWYEKIVKGGIG